MLYPASLNNKRPWKIKRGAIYISTWFKLDQPESPIQIQKVSISEIVYFSQSFELEVEVHQIIKYKKAFY